jgi:hypothetical protein
LGNANPTIFMTDTIPPTPEVPPGLREAAQLTKLIPFVGAGASKLAGCPDWNEFAEEALRVFVEHRKFSHAQLDQVKTLYLPLVRPELFNVGHLHELYRLLNLRFELFTENAKQATIEALSNIPIADGEAPGRVERLQFRWLNAISATSYAPAAKWLGELTAKYGSPPRHPDYLSRIETRWGPGPSQYTAEELVALADQRILIQKLTAFKPSDSWEGPTVDALTDQLERAVQQAPVAFIRVLPDLLAASITYQHAVIAGFLKLWREPNAERPFEGWDDAWPKLFDLFEALLANPTFWEGKSGAHGFREVTPMWIASSIADSLQAGTRDDSRAYPSALLPRGWALLQTLLAHGEAVSEPSDDPMFQAINSTRGRALEGVFRAASTILRQPGSAFSEATPRY